MRGGSVSAAALALAISATVWHFGSPYWTLKQMRAAAAARDSATLASYVDFPALRDSLGAEVDLAMQAVQPGDGGAALGAASLDPLIDRLVSQAGPAQPVELAQGGFEIDREGFSTFRALNRRDPAAAALVFRRKGYVWKLAAIDLPSGAPSATP